MKVLYIDIETGGHHQTYLKALMDIPGKETPANTKSLKNSARNNRILMLI